MRHILLTTLLFISSLVSMAQELVTPPANAEIKTYYLQAFSYITGENPTYEVRVAVADKVLYIQGLFEALPEAWIAGYFDKNIGLFPTDQYMGTVNPEQFPEQEHESYDVYFRCSEDMKDTSTMIVEYNPLNDTFEAYYEYILFSEKDNFNTFEHLQNVSFFSGQKILNPAPEGVKMKSYQLKGIDYGGKNVSYNVSIGMRDGEVYAQGLSRDFPDVWTYGTIDAKGMVSFMRNQYMGETTVNVHIDETKVEPRQFDIWFTGIDYEERLFGPVVLYYDEEEDNFEQPEQNWMIFNGDPAALHFLQILRNVTITHIDSSEDGEYTLITPPAGIEHVTYTLTGTDYTHKTPANLNYDVTVARNGVDIYIKGLYADMPTAWIHGTTNGSTLSFGSSQYLGKWYGQFDTWMLCSNNASTSCEITFTYDASKQAYTLDGGKRLYFADNANKISNMNFSIYGDITLSPTGSAGIGHIVTNEKSNALYDLQGKKVNANTPAHGLYILNGRKTIR